jgi:hypothetical protein
MGDFDVDYPKATVRELEAIKELLKSKWNEPSIFSQLDEIKELTKSGNDSAILAQLEEIKELLKPENRTETALYGQMLKELALLHHDIERIISLLRAITALTISRDRLSKAYEIMDELCCRGIDDQDGDLFRAIEHLQ